MTPKLVIFDCDGVLVETESITTRVIANNLKRYGLNLAPEHTHSLFVGGTLASAGEEAERRGATLPAGWLDEITQEVNASLMSGVEVFDGVHGLLDALADAGIATAVASNGPMSKMRISLGPSGLWDRLEGRIFSGRDTHAPKPRPDMLFAACAMAGCDPGAAVMIDDTIAGARAAVAAGTRAIGFVEASDPAPLQGMGVPIAHNMSEVRRLLGLAA